MVGIAVPLNRCDWANTHPLLMDYHDREWGVYTEYRERLFEMLILEGVQAGLSWLTVLKRRAAYQEAFMDWRPDVAAAWSDEDLERLMTRPGIIHNRAKILSHRSNARAFMAVEDQFGGFGPYLWQWTGGRPLVHHFERADQVPPFTQESERLSRDLVKRGFRFVGPTICYSYLQSLGVVVDHLVSCYRYQT